MPQIAINLFTDNVPTLAIQSPIIRGIPNMFCPTAVYMMETEVVTRIAGESEEKTMERDAILRRMETLEKGARICKQYAKRPQGINHQNLAGCMKANRIQFLISRRMRSI